MKLPSLLIGAQSGGVQIISGNPWSGVLLPRGGIQLRSSPENASGVIYVGLSGGIQINSGTGTLGAMDAMPLLAGDTYWVPKSAITQGTGVSGVGALSGFTITGSGLFNLFATTQANASGTFRLCFEVF